MEAEKDEKSKLLSKIAKKQDTRPKRSKKNQSPDFTTPHR